MFKPNILMIGLIKEEIKLLYFKTAKKDKIINIDIKIIFFL